MATQRKAQRIEVQLHAGKAAFAVQGLADLSKGLLLCLLALAAAFERPRWGFEVVVAECDCAGMRRMPYMRWSCASERPSKQAGATGPLPWKTSVSTLPKAGGTKKRTPKFQINSFHLENTLSSVCHVLQLLGFFFCKMVSVKTISNEGLDTYQSFLWRTLLSGVSCMLPPRIDSDSKKAHSLYIRPLQPFSACRLLNRLTLSKDKHSLLAMSQRQSFEQQLLDGPTPLSPGAPGPRTAWRGPASATASLQALPPLLPQGSGVAPSHIQAAGRMQDLSQQAHLEFLALETYERETAVLIERALALKPLLGMCSWIRYLQGRMEHSLPLPCLTADENAELRNRFNTAVQSARAALAERNRISETGVGNFRARAARMLHWPGTELGPNNGRDSLQQRSM